MLTLTFKNELTQSKFASSNMFFYSFRRASGIIYSGAEKELPYILRAGESFHLGNELCFCTDNQFRGRRLDVAKVREIFDSAQMPIAVRSAAGEVYFIGKGYIGTLHNNTLHTLFVAICKPGPIKSIKQVKFIVSKELYNLEQHKKIWSIVKPVVDNHLGDVLITNNISQYMGIHLELPTFTTISKKMEYNKKLVSHCISVFKNNVVTLENK